MSTNPRSPRAADVSFPSPQGAPMPTEEANRVRESFIEAYDVCAARIATFVAAKDATERLGSVMCFAVDLVRLSCSILSMLLSDPFFQETLCRVVAKMKLFPPTHWNLTGFESVITWSEKLRQVPKTQTLSAIRRSLFELNQTLEDIDLPDPEVPIADVDEATLLKSLERYAVEQGYTAVFEPEDPGDENSSDSQLEDDADHVDPAPESSPPPVVTRATRQTNRDKGKAKVAEDGAQSSRWVIMNPKVRSCFA